MSATSMLLVLDSCRIDSRPFHRTTTTARLPYHPQDHLVVDAGGVAVLEETVDESRRQTTQHQRARLLNVHRGRRRHVGGRPAVQGIIAHVGFESNSAVDCSGRGDAELDWQGRMVPAQVLLDLGPREGAVGREEGLRYTLSTDDDVVEGTVSIYNRDMPA